MSNKGKFGWVLILLATFFTSNIFGIVPGIIMGLVLISLAEK